MGILISFIVSHFIDFSHTEWTKLTKWIQCGAEWDCFILYLRIASLIIWHRKDDVRGDENISEKRRYGQE